MEGTTANKNLIYARGDITPPKSRKASLPVQAGHHGHHHNVSLKHLQRYLEVF